MRFHRYIVLLPFLCCAFDVKAQVGQEPASAPQQWQMTLDVIKSRAQTLMMENGGLQLENRQLANHVRALRQAIGEQQNRNELIAGYLRKRHGQTDQQARIEELTQAVKTKRQQVRELDGQVSVLKKKQAALNPKVEQLENTTSDLGARPKEEKVQDSLRPSPRQEDELSAWRKQLEEANRQEALLQNELDDLKTGGKVQNPDVIDQQNKQLQADVGALRAQLLQRQKSLADASLSEANVRRYQELKQRKDELLADINDYESRLDGLRESALLTLSWKAKKKALVHEMVEADQRNNQTRDKIKQLREDINILKDRVSELEGRLDSSKVQDLDLNEQP